MEQDFDFAALMARVQTGCMESAQFLHDRYGAHILRAVRRFLNVRLRPKFDSVDFVQDVWVSFFADLPRKLTFHRPRDLVAFLTAVARNKVAEMHRDRLQRQKYNINREQSLDQFPGGFPALQTNLPTPSEVVMGREAWEVLLENQPPVHRHILNLIREGKKTIDIVRELGVSQKTVRRVVQKNFPGRHL